MLRWFPVAAGNHHRVRALLLGREPGEATLSGKHPDPFRALPALPARLPGQAFRSGVFGHSHECVLSSPEGGCLAAVRSLRYSLVFPG